MRNPFSVDSFVSVDEVLLRLLQRFINYPNQIRQIHSHLLTGGHLFSKSKDPKASSSTKCKLTFIYNTLIRAYLNMGQSRSTLILFSDMLTREVHPNNLTFPSLIKAASSSSFSACISGVALHSQAFRRGVLSDPFVLTSFLRLYAEVGNLSDVCKIFDEIRHPCIVTRNAMLDAYGRNGDMDSALQLFMSMPEKDVVSWTSIVNGFAKNGCYNDAVRLFAEMMVHVDMVGGRVKPNEATLVSMLSSCANLDQGGIYLGKQIHGYILLNGISPSAFLATSLIDLYGKFGHAEMATRVFHQTEAKEVCTWNAMISSLACNGREKQAIDMFEKMKVQRLRPNAVTFVSVLTACARARLMDLGMGIFQSMSLEYGVVPLPEHYGCVVDLLGRAGHFSEAIDFVRNMPLKPDASVLGALLGACKIHGETQLGNEVGERLLNLQPRYCGQYVALSNINAVSKRWGLAAELRKAMIKAGVRKIPAHSLISATLISSK